jgi:hypothetical protein
MYTQCMLFQGSCDTDHYLVIVKVRERLLVSKQVSQKSNVERFSLKKLSELFGRSIRLKSQTGLLLWRT